MARRGQQDTPTQYVAVGRGYHWIDNLVSAARKVMIKELTSANAAGKDGSHYAVVFDIDDTLLMTGGEVRSCNAMHDLYHLALANKVNVFFVTARRDTPMTREFTQNQLSEFGYKVWNGLFFMPADYMETHHNFSGYKADVRDHIHEAYSVKILFNIGDQWADMFRSPPYQPKKKVSRKVGYVFKSPDSHTVCAVKLPNLSHEENAAVSRCATGHYGFSKRK